MDDIAITVKEYILKEFLPGEDPDELTNDTPLIADGILDSLATLKLVDFLEERYGISVEPHEADEDNLGCIDEIVRFVKAKR